MSLELSEKSFKYIMKHPFPFLFTSIAIFGIFPLAIVVLKFQAIVSLGMTSILFFGCVFGVAPMLLWWLFSYIIVKNSFYKYKDVNSNKINYNEEVISWISNITVGSGISAIYCGTMLICSWLFGWSFKAFLGLCILFPIIRMIFYFTIEKKIIKKQVDKGFKL